MNREEYINNDLKQKWNYAKNKGYNVVAMYLQGSQNYELDIYDNEYKSDIDVKAIVLPTLEDIVLNKKPISTTLVLENNEHIELNDIRIMVDMWKKQKISYIELLFTEFYIFDDEYVDLLTQLKDKADYISNINKNQFLKCIKGMSMEKFKALEHPYPNTIDKIEKFGYDPKQLHHIVRLNVFLKEYLFGEGTFDLCYVPDDIDRINLLNLKKGLDLNYEKISLEKAREIANSNDKQTKRLVDNFIENNKEIVDYETIEFLNYIVYNMIKRCLRKEIKND